MLIKFETLCFRFSQQQNMNGQNTMIHRHRWPVQQYIHSSIPAVNIIIKLWHLNAEPIRQPAQYKSDGFLQLSRHSQLWRWRKLRTSKTIRDCVETVRFLSICVFLRYTILIFMTKRFHESHDWLVQLSWLLCLLYSLDTLKGRVKSE